MKPLEQFTEEEFAHQVHRAVRALPDAPAAWQQAAVALWPATSPVQQAVAAGQALVRFITAALTFDSWATPGLAYGMRSTRSATRHLLFSAEGRDIDLRIAPMAEHFALTGQILGPDEAGEVELALVHAPDTARHHGALDALGEFRIEGVSAGRYVLTLRLGAQPIVMQPIEVGEPAAEVGTPTA
jgi:hypothetical protein